MTAKTQCDRVLAVLESGRALTPMEAMTELGIFRLAARIDDLKKEGYLIESRLTEVRNRFGESCRVASYRLIKEAVAA